MLAKTCMIMTGCDPVSHRLHVHACYSSSFMCETCMFQEPVRVSYACFSKIAHAMHLASFLKMQKEMQQCISDIYLLTLMKITYSCRNRL